jgi:PAS domain S-box-containing protein
MRVFKSLSAKYALVSIIILTILSAFLYASVDFTRHMAGEAASMNATGQLRFRSYQMAWYAQRLAEEAFSLDLRTHARANLSQRIQEYDKLIQDLATGSVRKHTTPITHYSEILPIFETTKKDWEHGLKPSLVKIAALPLDAPEVQMRALLLEYDERLPGFVDDVDELVKALELHYDKEIQHFVQQRLLIVTIFTFAALLVAWYIRKYIVTPMKLLTRSALRLQGGDFDVQTPIRSNDEIGTLSAVFNGMAGGLKELFAEKSRKLREFDALSTISRAASESLAVDVMAGRIMDAILSLEPLALEKKGAIFISDRDKKTLELIVSRNFSGEQVRGCGIVRYGECLCGIAAEQNEIILSDNNVHDSRHTKIYSAASEHGHIILPLKARDKLIGVVCLYLPQGMKPSAEDQRLYQSIADIIAVALQNAINHRQVAMLAQSLNSSNDMIVITDTEGGIIHFNPEAIRELGYSTTELIGQPISLIQSTHNPPGLGEEIFKNTLEGGGWRGEVVTRRKDGSEFPALLTTSLVRAEDGQALALVGIARNITSLKQADGALRASEGKYRTLIEEINDGLFIMDARGTFTFVNSALARIHGYEKPDDLVGKSFIELTAPENREALERDFIRNMGSGRDPGVIEIPIERPDRSRAYIQVHPVNIVEDGRVVGTRGIVRDVTERKRAEDELSKYSQDLLALNVASNSVTGITDVKTIYATICDNALKLFDVKMAWIGMVQKGTYAVVPIAYAGADDDYLSSVRVTWDDSPTGTGPAGMSIKTRLPYLINTDDPMFTLWAQEAQKRGFGSVLGVPLICAKEDCIGTLLLYAGEPDFFTVNAIRLCQIFANQAATAIENARLVEGLEEKVAERTREFEISNRQLEILNDDLMQQRSVARRAKHDAEAANSAKSDFLANMSHELRTPLNSILGFSEIMRDGLAGEVNPQQKEYLNDVWESGSHLLRLINDILDISKIEAGKMELERGVIDFNSLLGETLVFFREKATRHTISLHFEVAEDLPTITADERKIKQVLINLLTNALKFTPDGGDVGVDASVEAEELRVTVWDTGIGIAPEDLGRLFQPFQQLESPLTKKHQGTGLGLHLCRKIVELHGGRIWVESTPGQGSRFTFAIPIAAAAGDRS